MIKVNLTPPDELDNPYWYLPELIAGLLMLGLSYFSVQYFLELQKDQVQVVRVQANQKMQESKAVQQEVQRYNLLTEDYTALVEKRLALENITTSKIKKLKPVIFLEHFQNIKPNGLWYYELSLSKEQQFEVKGRAFDNLLIAELLGSMRRTSTQEYFESDIRTHVYFSGLDLDKTIADRDGQDVALFPELSGYPRFLIKGNYESREPVKTETKNISWKSVKTQQKAKF